MEGTGKALIHHSMGRYVENSTWKKRCRRARGTHDLDTRQHDSSVAFTSHKWSRMRSSISGGREGFSEDMMIQWSRVSEPSLDAGIIALPGDPSGRFTIPISASLGEPTLGNRVSAFWLSRRESNHFGRTVPPSICKIPEDTTLTICKNRRSLSSSPRS